MHDTSKTYQEQAEEITLLKQRIQELQESESRYKMLFSNAAEGILVAELQTKQFIHANPALCRMFGFSEEEILHLRVEDIHPKDSLADVLSEFETLARGEKACAIDIPCTRKDGSVFYADIRTASMVLDGVMCNVGYFTDITERKRAEEKLLLIQKAVEDSSDAIALTDAQGNHFYQNKAFTRLLGYTVDELKVQGVAQTVYADQEVARNVFETIMKGGSWSGEVEDIAKDGRRLTVMLGADAIKDETGKIIGLLAINTDITERKHAEESLSKSERKFSSTFHLNPNGMAISDIVTSKFIDVNEVFTSQTGYSREEIIGNSAEDLQMWVNPDDREQVINALKEKGEIKSSEVLMRVKNDNIRNVLFSARFIEIEQDHYLLTFAQDITDRKRAEEELIRVNRALRMLSDTNHALIQIMDEATLLNEVCRIIVDVGGYRMAMVGFAEHDEAKTILPVAHAGFESGYIESINVTWADNERGRGPGGTAIRTGKPSIAHNIQQDPAFALWREAAIERGYKSNIALPLISAGQTFGELSIYSADTDAFDAREVEILKELADNLAFGITSLRKHVKGEQAEVALRESEEQYRLIAENTADTIAVYDLNLNPTYISPSILNLRGYTVQETMTQAWNQILTPDSLELTTKMFADQMALESSGTADPARTAYIDLEEYCKDGSTIWVELAASFLRDNNFKPIGILTVTRNITARKQAELELQKTLERLRKSFGATVQVMASALEARDPYTAGHQKRVADLARSIATEMGLNKDKIEGIRTAGSIHDIGKLAIPSEILTKPTKLTDLEFSLIKEHSESGYEMLKNVESPWPLAQIVYQHHERMNGSGYPRKLKGEEIIIEARIMAVADVVEAMASHRPYRPGLGLDAALEEIEKNKGIIYDADVVDACLRLFREKGYKLT